MKIRIKWETTVLKKILLLLGMVLMFLSGTPIIGSAETDHTSSENVDLSTLQLKRIAVMPFLVCLSDRDFQWQALVAQCV